MLKFHENEALLCKRSGGTAHLCTLAGTLIRLASSMAEITQDVAAY